MILNGYGEVVKNGWESLLEHYPNILLDEYIVMPNHFHGIIIINNNDAVGVPLVGAQNTNNKNAINRADTRPAPTIGDIIGVFKSMTTNEYIHNVKENGWQPFNGKLWQRNYYEHIIRDEDELDQKRQYILDNPIKWETDEN